jgi:hypothetical protein
MMRLKPFSIRSVDSTLILPMRLSPDSSYHSQNARTAEIEANDRIEWIKSS